MRFSATLVLTPLLATISTAQNYNSAALSGLGIGGSTTSCPKIAPGPLSTSQLANTFSPTVINDPVSIEAIRGTLALYPFAIDGKNFNALDKVFTQNAVANYSTPIFVLSGLAAIKTTLATSLGLFAGTHHTYGTQFIDVCSLTNAVAVTYFTASHFFSSDFGSIEDNTDVLYAYGRYEDTLARQSDGTWRVTYRNLVYMGPLIFHQPTNATARRMR